MLCELDCCNCFYRSNNINTYLMRFITLKSKFVLSVNFFSRVHKKYDKINLLCKTWLINILTRCGACNKRCTAAIWNDIGIVVLNVWYRGLGGSLTLYSMNGSRSFKYCTRQTKESPSISLIVPFTLLFSFTFNSSIIVKK